MTEKDHFIGLNAEGRLIQVEEESTTLHLGGSVPHSQAIHLVTQELLPLSMFLRAVGGTVKVRPDHLDASLHSSRVTSLRNSLPSLSSLLVLVLTVLPPFLCPFLSFCLCSFPPLFLSPPPHTPLYPGLSPVQ